MSQESGRPRGTLGSVLALLPTAALVALGLAGPILSGDLWWHLRTGEWILTHGELPRTDPFSHTAGETRWILQEYGSQVLFALAHRALGFAGLKALGVLLGLATLALVFRAARRLVETPWAAAATALFAVLFALKWELRPHLISVLFVLRLAELAFPRGELAGARPSLRVFAEVLVLSAVWVQLHAEALFAPIFATAGLIGAALGAAWDRKETSDDPTPFGPPSVCPPGWVGRGGAGRARAWGRIAGWLALTGCALAGTLLSPLGQEPHEYALLRRSVPQQYIEEWFRPWIPLADPRFHPLSPGVFFTWVAATAVGAGFVLREAWRRLATRGAVRLLPWERIGFLACCLALALSARRFFWLSWFPAVECLALVLAARPRLAGQRLLPWAAALLLAVPLAGSHYVRHALGALGAGRFGDVVDDRLFPVAATEFAADAGLEGNLFHRYEWGGYLGYRLGDDCPVFIDGRTVLFEDVIPERWNAERDPAVARRVLDERDVRVIVFLRLVDHGAGPVPWRPPGESEWVRVWRDSLAVVWIRADDAENMERVRAAHTHEGVAFDPARGFLEAAALDARPEWLETKRVLPAPVAARIRAHDPADRSPSARLERSLVYDELRMRSNARYELDAALGELGPEGVPLRERLRAGADLAPIREAARTLLGGAGG